MTTSGFRSHFERKKASLSPVLVDKVYSRLKQVEKEETLQLVDYAFSKTKDLQEDNISCKPRKFTINGEYKPETTESEYLTANDKKQAIAG